MRTYKVVVVHDENMREREKERERSVDELDSNVSEEMFIESCVVALETCTND
jgi:hypothetical protein